MTPRCAVACTADRPPHCPHASRARRGLARTSAGRHQYSTHVVLGHHGDASATGARLAGGTNAAASSAGSSGGRSDLDQAFQRVQQALMEAEAAVEKVPGWVRSGSTLARYAVLLALLVASHSFGRAPQVACAVVGGSSIGAWGYRRGSLSASGAAAAAAVGAATLAASLRAGVTLLAFYFASSKLTALKEDLKQADEAFKPGGQRDWVQVMCNGAVPAALALAAAWGTGLADLPLGGSARYTGLASGVLGYFACCCGDTWASELGQLSEDTPRLITSLRPVRKGTNGGVTLLGLLASVCGGLFVGVVFYAAGLLSPTLRAVPGNYRAAALQWPLILLGVLGGIVGSLVDSVLGATVQFTGYNRKTHRVTGKLGPDVVPICGFPFLDNNAVNFASASATSLLIASIASHLF